MTNEKPKRIQRKRTRGWCKPPNTVIVDRTSRFGNPFKIPEAIQWGFAGNEDDARKLCINAFRDWVEGKLDWPRGEEQRQWILDHIHELRGKDLACFCKEGLACHADVLIELANR